LRVQNVVLNIMLRKKLANSDTYLSGTTDTASSINLNNFHIYTPLASERGVELSGSYSQKQKIVYFSNNWSDESV